MATQVDEALEEAARTRLWLFTVQDYERLAEIGILDEDARVELICGEILKMVPIGDRHNATVARLNDLLRVTSQESIIWVQGSIRLSGNSEPQPDVCLVKRRSDYYGLGKPGPADVQLLIEVADSSLVFDRSVKLAVYASAAIQEVWIVNLSDNVVEVSTEPRDGVYTKHLILPRGAYATPAAFPMVRLAVDEILGPPVV